MIDIVTAILAINPSAEVSVNAEDFEQITWHNGTAVISKADIQAKQAELQADYDAKQYQRDRIKRPENGGYPEISDQMDMIYHDQVDGTTIFKDTIKAVKDANPKP